MGSGIGTGTGMGMYIMPPELPYLLPPCLWKGVGADMEGGASQIVLGSVQRPPGRAGCSAPGTGRGCRGVAPALWSSHCDGLDD
eukprot:1156518-Pelagomonas_calceolata.AAC.2